MSKVRLVCICIICIVLMSSCSLKENDNNEVVKDAEVVDVDTRVYPNSVTADIMDKILVNTLGFVEATQYFGKTVRDDSILSDNLKQTVKDVGAIDIPESGSIEGGEKHVKDDGVYEYEGVAYVVKDGRAYMELEDVTNTISVNSWNVYTQGEGIDLYILICTDKDNKTLRVKVKYNNKESKIVDIEVIK